MKANQISQPNSLRRDKISQLGGVKHKHMEFHLVVSSKTLRLWELRVLDYPNRKSITQTHNMQFNHI